MENLIYGILGILIGGFVGYLSGYMKKKGENLATHEDFKAVLTELKEATRATKEIEAKISDDVWDRQKKWEIKKEALFEVLRALHEFDDALSTIHSTFYLESLEENKGMEMWLEKKSQALDLWAASGNRFEQAKFLAELVCKPELNKALTDIGVAMRKTYQSVSNGDYAAFTSSMVERIALTRKVFQLMRKELAIETKL